jgi:hypothetical protein
LTFNDCSRASARYVIEDWSWRHMRDENVESALAAPDAHDTVAYDLAVSSAR